MQSNPNRLLPFYQLPIHLPKLVPKTLNLDLTNPFSDSISPKMNSPLTTSFTSSSSSTSSLSLFNFGKPCKFPSFRASANFTNCIVAYSGDGNEVKVGVERGRNPLVLTLKTAATAVVLTAASASIMGKKLPLFQAVAETITEDVPNSEAELDRSVTPLQEFLQTNDEQAVDALKSLLKQHLENGEDEEALNVLEKLVLAQPLMTDCKFLKARLLSEMGKTDEAREVFEDILKGNPLSFEALFENALLMDRCGEGEAVIKRLEEALRLAEEESKAKEARDVKLIMAQIMFLQKNVDEALNSYEELRKEDPSDFRPYFCKGMIYSLLDRNDEAKVEFAKYRELSPKKFEVEGYMRTPLSRMKIFGGNDEN